MKRWMTLGLLLAPLACSESAPPMGADATEGTPDEDAPSTPLIVYRASDPTVSGSYYLRRQGEEPILLGSSASETVDRMCLGSDGSGYVRWVERGASTLEPSLYRVESFAVGEDWVATGGPSPFPPGLAPDGCPFEGGDGVRYVNILHEGGDPRPYRIATDGSMSVVAEAQAAWRSLGGYALEEREDALVIWDLQGPNAAVVKTYTGVRRWGGFVGNDWIELVWEDGRHGMVRAEELDQEPLMLAEEPTEINVSASGEFMSLQRAQGGTARVELIRMDESGVAERTAWLGVGASHGPPTDAGFLLLSSALHPGEVLVASLERGPALFHAMGDDAASIYAWASASTTRAVVAEDLAEDGGTRYTLRDLSDGTVAVPLVLPPSCDRSRLAVRGRHAFFGCGEEGFHWTELLAAQPEIFSLADLTPPGAVANTAFAFSWGGEDWYELIFTGNGGYVPVFVRADGMASIDFDHPEQPLVSASFLPGRKSRP